MGYHKAVSVLPKELLLKIQEYVDGEYLYIPRKEECKRNWGAKTCTKQVTAHRNTEIYRKYQSGKSSRELADEYCLAVKSIQGIITKMKREIA